MFRRDDTVFRRSGSNVLVGSGYTVVAYRPGAVASAVPSGLTLPVFSGHGFVGGEKILVYTTSNGAFTYSGIHTVSTANAESLVMSGGSFTFIKGDLIFNLGVDSSATSTPNYTASPIAIYSDPATAISQARINTATDGEYGYWHNGIRIWEIILQSSTPVDIRQEATGPQFDGTIRYAHHFASGGTGTSADPWVTAGSNPIQAALDNLPASGGTVRMVPGYYTLGSATAAVTVPPLTDNTDTRGYRFEGAGRDLVFLRYSGTGSAFRYIGTTQQSNQMVFKGFSLMQTGTARTGYGFWGSYVSESLFEDLNVGCRREDRQSGDQDNGWAIGLRLEATTGSHVTDFNRFHRCYFLGNTVGLYIDNQGDNTVVDECSFEPRQDALVAQDGCHIHNSKGVRVTSNHFNFFDNNSNSFGLRISGSSAGVQVSANYFERCKLGVVLYTDDTIRGVSITGNSFSFTAASTSIGIKAGLHVGSDAAGFELHGCHISGNSFFVLSSGNTGIHMGAEARGFVIAGNGYNNTGGTNRTIQGGAGVDDGTHTAGARGVVIESLNETNDQPVIQLFDCTASAQGEILIQNQSTSNSPSPRIHIVPGSGGAGLGCYVAVAANGDFQVQNDVGTVRFTVTQAGAISSVAGASIGGAAAVTGASTLTGGIVGGIPRNVGTWQPPTATPGSYKQPVTTEMYVGSIFVPANMTVTGIQYLIGTATPVAEKVIVALFGQTGTKVAQSVAGGTNMTTTPSIKQQVAFSPGTYAAIGPGWYFIGLMFGTATANLVAMIPAAADVGSGVVGVAVTGLTALTPPASITPPTTFPGAALVPIASLY